MPTIDKKLFGFPAHRRCRLNVVNHSSNSGSIGGSNNSYTLSTSDSDDTGYLRTRFYPQQRALRKRLKAGSQHSCDVANPNTTVEKKPSVDVADVELKFPPPKTKPCPAPPCPHSFWWAPKPSTSKQQKSGQKNVEAAPRPTDYMNVMYDKRVIRGPNFSAALLAKSDPFDRAAELRRKNALKKVTQQFCKPKNRRNVIGTVPPVPGRLHTDVQTDKHLEELVAREPAFDATTQTDLFLEKPPEPPYVPSKVGIDMATEIADGELFHFDAEAQPIIEVLVDGAIEQSMLEVAHEQELNALREKQEDFLSQREAELAKLRRLEAEEIRLQGEKQRRLEQDRISRDLDKQMQRAVIAAKLLQGHISSLLPEIWNNLEPATDAAKKEVLMKTLCPWLADSVKTEHTHITQSRNVLSGIVEGIIKERAAVYAGYREEEPSEEKEDFGYPCEEEEECEPCEPECCVCSSDSSSEVCSSFDFGDNVNQ